MSSVKPLESRPSGEVVNAGGGTGKEDAKSSAGVPPPLGVTIRSVVSSNVTQGHLGYAYDLGSRLLDHPQPKRPLLTRSFYILDNLFEARIGALIVEGRDSEVRDWVYSMLDGQQNAIKLAVENQRKKLQDVTDGAKLRKKRMMDAPEDEDSPAPLVQLIAACALPNTHCLSSTYPITWDEGQDSQQYWHCHLQLAGKDAACGRSKNKAGARAEAVTSLLVRLPGQVELQRLLAVAVGGAAEIAEEPFVAAGTDDDKEASA
ncbi:hypothetical protein JCM10213_003964 [Rhodosporidiobolus nylandii]